MTPRCLDFFYRTFGWGRSGAGRQVDVDEATNRTLVWTGDRPTNVGDAIMCMTTVLVSVDVLCRLEIDPFSTSIYVCASLQPPASADVSDTCMYSIRRLFFEVLTLLCMFVNVWSLCTAHP